MLRRVLITLTIWSACFLVSILWGLKHEWPDFVHESYGFPFPWAIHTLVTIAGPADIWSVNITALLLDLVFWVLILGVALVIAAKIRVAGRPVD